MPSNPIPITTADPDARHHSKLPAPEQGDFASTAEAPQPKPLPRRGTPGDPEVSLKVDLVELNSARTSNRELMEEKLYELHALMSGKGREGLFTHFLRSDLGWTGSRPDAKARRWIARYKLRMGWINVKQYAKVTGNAEGSATSRTASSARPELPVLKQVWTEEEIDESEALTAQTFTLDEMLAAQRAIELRERAFIHAEMRRIVLSLGQHSWLASSIHTQRRRYGVKTDQEAIFLVFMRGKKAADDAEWLGREFDEDCERIGMNPLLANEPDQAEHDDEADYEDCELCLRDLRIELYEEAEAKRGCRSGQASERHDTDTDPPKEAEHNCPEDHETCFASPLLGATSTHFDDDYPDLSDVL